MEKDLSSRKSFGRASDQEEEKLKEQMEPRGVKDSTIQMPGTEWEPFIKEEVKKLRPKARAVVEELDRSFKEDYAQKEVELQNHRRENFLEAKKKMLFRTPSPGYRVGGGKKLRRRGQNLKDEAEKLLERSEKNELLKIKDHYRNNIKRILKREGLSAEPAKERESGDSPKDSYNLSSEKSTYLMDKFQNRSKENQGQELER